MDLLKASLEGLRNIKDKREKIGWPIDDDRWLIEASKFLPKVKNGKNTVPGTVSIGTWKRFIYGTAVKRVYFEAFCQVLELNWSDCAVPTTLTTSNQDENEKGIALESSLNVRRLQCFFPTAEYGKIDAIGLMKWLNVFSLENLQANQNRAQLISRDSLVREISESLAIHPIHIVTGASASGKTTLAIVAALEWRRTLNIEVFYTDIARIASFDDSFSERMLEDVNIIYKQRPDSYLIIDNAHISFNDVSVTVSKILLHFPELKILLTIVPDLPKYYAIAEKNPILMALKRSELHSKISCSDISREYISQFCENFHLPEEAVGDCESLLLLCGNNLYSLRFYLEGLLAVNSTQEGNIGNEFSGQEYKENYVANKLFEILATYGPEGLLVVAMLSVWSSVDIPIEKDFFDHKKGYSNDGLPISEGILASLIYASEIHEKWEMLYLPHRVIASSYIEAIKHSPGLDITLRKQLHDRYGLVGGVESNLIHLYLQWHPHSINFISKQLCNRTEILSEISSRPKTIKAIFEMMLSERNLIKTTEIFVNFEWQNHIISKELMSHVTKSADRIVQIFYEQDSIVPIIHFISPMWFVTGDNHSKKRGRSLKYSDVPDILSRSKNLEDIECCYMTTFQEFERYSNITASNLTLSDLDQSILEQNEEIFQPYSAELARRSSMCIKAFLYESPVLCSKLLLADSRPGKQLLLKIRSSFILQLLNSEESLRNTAYALSVINYYDSSLCKTLLESMQSDHLLTLLNDEGESLMAAYFITLVGQISSDFAAKLKIDLAPSVTDYVANFNWPNHLS